MSPSYNLTKIHVIGHSLGAQVASSLGDKLKSKNITLSRITGLDPAGKEGFETFDQESVSSVTRGTLPYSTLRVRYLTLGVPLPTLSYTWSTLTYPYLPFVYPYLP